jgi:hypothetical protein
MQQPDSDRSPQGTFLGEVFETISGRKTGVENDDDSVMTVGDEAPASRASTGGTTAGETDLEEGDIDASAG